MDNVAIKDLMFETAVSILETAAFLFVDESDLEQFEFKDYEMCGGEISFSGFCNGRVVLRMAVSIAEISARNMLGMDEDCVVEDKQRKDAVLEIMNMITGNLLTSIFGDKVVFKLNMPVYSENDDISDLSSESAVIMSVESAPIVLVFQNLPAQV